MKNFFNSLPATKSQSLTAAVAKVGTFMFIFICLQACSQSSPSDKAANQAHSSLTDTAAVSLGDTPSREYRLFKFTRKSGDQTFIDLKVLRLKDLKETLVSTLPVETDSASVALAKINGGGPKFYWSKESQYLITENSVPDSMYKREVVIFDLNSFSVMKRKQGNLLNYDVVNDFAFMYRTTAERQIICFYNVSMPDQEQVREIVAAPAGKLPIVLIAPIKREARVKAYMTGAVPINIAFNY